MASVCAIANELLIFLLLSFITEEATRKASYHLRHYHHRHIPLPHSPLPHPHHLYRRRCRRRHPRIQCILPQIPIRPSGHPALHILLLPHRRRLLFPLLLLPRPPHLLLLLLLLLHMLGCKTASAVVVRDLPSINAIQCIPPSQRPINTQTPSISTRTTTTETTSTTIT